ncbi:hypothetical protein [Saccharopolyspora antimicrobica]|uniref:hypothetical protein n=1 Tax=Saccharopolyspora antimicrobica TaxID=455193 RepID=UPI000B84F38C|nr:hypothetical protein [Saccharopolyspora antimicrobica]
MLRGENGEHESYPRRLGVPPVQQHRNLVADGPEHLLGPRPRLERLLPVQREVGERDQVVVAAATSDHQPQVEVPALRAGTTSATISLVRNGSAGTVAS